MKTCRIWINGRCISWSFLSILVQKKKNWFENTTLKFIQTYFSGRRVVRSDYSENSYFKPSWTQRYAKIMVILDWLLMALHVWWLDGLKWWLPFPFSLVIHEFKWHIFAFFCFCLGIYEFVWFILVGMFAIFAGAFSLSAKSVPSYAFFLPVISTRIQRITSVFL